MNNDAGGFDAIVIGSGIGGLVCACALTRSELKVLVLERYVAAGGLTQTFGRSGFTWAVGLHYLGDIGEEASARKILDWLSGNVIRFAPSGPVNDTVYLPAGFEFQVARSQRRFCKNSAATPPYQHGCDQASSGSCNQHGD
jgi:all-trans-retinol 13,14-reductase